MDCHQILSGACNVGDKCFAIGSVEGINFTVSITHHSVDLFLGTKKFFINAHQICWLVASKDEMNKHSFLMLVFFSSLSFFLNRIANFFFVHILSSIFLFTSSNILQQFMQWILDTHTHQPQIMIIHEYFVWHYINRSDLETIIIGSI